MPSIKYNEIFSSFYLKAESYDILNLKSTQVNEFLNGWLCSSLSKPYIRRLFSNFKIDNEIQIISYEMKYSTDEEYDKNFVIDIAAIGMVIEWITPKINSLTNILQMYGSKEEKFYSQKNHLDGLKDLKASLLREQKGLIRDRGYIWNTYLDGNK